MKCLVYHDDSLTRQDFLSINEKWLTLIQISAKKQNNYHGKIFVQIYIDKMFISINIIKLFVNLICDITIPDLDPIASTLF